MIFWISICLVAIACAALTLAPAAFGVTHIPALVWLGVAALLLIGLYAASKLSAHSDIDHRSGRLMPLVALTIAVLATIAVAFSNLSFLPVLQKSEPTEINAGIGHRAVAIRIRKSADGRFRTQGLVNKVSLPLVIDTGAASIILRASDATAAGIAVSELDYKTPIRTANGTAYTAPVEISKIQIGLLKLSNVEALVVKPGNLNESLLGMSFLRRLSSYDIAGDFLTLRN